MRGFIEFTLEQADEEEPKKSILIRTKNIVGIKDMGDGVCELIIENDIDETENIEIEEHYQTAVAKLERATRGE